jgi:hypothetical protein
MSRLWMKPMISSPIAIMAPKAPCATTRRHEAGRQDSPKREIFDVLLCDLIRWLMALLECWEFVVEYGKRICILVFLLYMFLNKSVECVIIHFRLKYALCITVPLCERLSFNAILSWFYRYVALCYDPGCMGEQVAKRPTSPGCMGEVAKRTTGPGCMGEQVAKQPTSSGCTYEHGTT